MSRLRWTNWTPFCFHCELERQKDSPEKWGHSKDWRQWLRLSPLGPKSPPQKVPASKSDPNGSLDVFFTHRGETQFFWKRKKLQLRGDGRQISFWTAIALNERRNYCQRPPGLRECISTFPYRISITIMKIVRIGGDHHFDGDDDSSLST